MKKVYEALEKWMIESGLIDQLAFIVAKTSAVRALVLWACGAIAIKGLKESSYWETIVASLVTIATGSVTMFISHVRTKYAAQLQHAVGERTDSFVGPQTVATVVNIVASSGSGSSAINQAPDLFKELARLIVSSPPVPLGPQPTQAPPAPGPVPSPTTPTTPV